MGGEKGYLVLEVRRMKKAILKYAAGALEKLAVGSMLVGLYQDNKIGIYIGIGCFVAGSFFIAWEARK